MSSRIEGFSLSLGASSLARMLKPERKLPRVVLHMIDADRAQLFVDGRPATTGPLSEATNKIREIGYRPGDEFQMVHPNGEQLMVRLRTPEERAAGVSAIARRIPKEETGT